MRMRTLLSLLRNVVLAAFVVVAGCEDDDDSSSHDFGENDENTIVAMGDSITAGYGLAASESYPAQLSYLVGKTVVNAGADAAQSSSGVASVNDYLTSYTPGYLIILYGINDIINRKSTDALIGNLTAIIQAAKDNSTVPVVGNLTPIYGNYTKWATEVDDANRRIKSLANSQNVKMANLNNAFGNDRSLIQDDGLHPSADGAAVIASKFSGLVD